MHACIIDYFFVFAFKLNIILLLLPLLDVTYRITKEITGGILDNFILWRLDFAVNTSYNFVVIFSF